MNKLLWRFANTMFGLLDPDERAVVLGDFAEAGTGPRQALQEPAGLVLRRQAAAWRHWEPWVVLTGIVIPLGILLSHVSRSWADGAAIGAFIYVDNWTWHQLDSVGARRDFIDFLVGVATGSLALIAWSWTAGFVLGRMARRIRPLSQVAECGRCGSESHEARIRLSCVVRDQSPQVNRSVGASRSTSWRR